MFKKFFHMQSFHFHAGHIPRLKSGFFARYGGAVARENSAGDLARPYPLERHNKIYSTKDFLKNKRG